MRALVVDDELPAREELGWLLSQCEVEVVGSLSSAEEALEFLKLNSVDVVFLDIEMPGISGMRLGEMIYGTKGVTPDIIFVTAYQERAVDAFEIEATDYLLKPVRLERLRKAVEKVTPSLATQEHASVGGKKLTRISVEHRGVYNVVALTEILAFESEDGIVLAYTKEENFVTDFSLKFLENNLDKEFFYRCHRGFIVRIDAITKIAPWGAGTFQLTLSNSKIVPLARSRASELRALMPATMSSFSSDE